MPIRAARPPCLCGCPPKGASSPTSTLRTVTCSGTSTQHQFFETIETLHRRLFLGPLGALVVELTTCWTIVLLLTGAYLWWPRKDRRLWGVLLPRLRGHPYVVLRDLHSVCGISVWLVALICAGTGLFYSSLTGSAFKLALRAASGFVQDPQPPSSRSPVDATTVPVDRILATAHGNFSDARFPPRKRARGPDCSIRRLPKPHC
jgi:uncharacterized iron-regulated membrane protein